MVGPGKLQHCADNRRRDSHQECEHDAERQEPQRNTKALHELRTDIDIVNARPEIPDEQAGEPHPVSVEKWLIEPQLDRHGVQHLGRRRRLHGLQFRERIAGEADDDEHEKAGDQHHRDHDKQSPDQIG